MRKSCHGLTRTVSETRTASKKYPSVDGNSGHQLIMRTLRRDLLTS